MRYYLVKIASSRYKGNDTLLYSSKNNLKPGQIVTVPLKNSQVLGIIETTGKPANKQLSSAAIKPVSKVISQNPLPGQLLRLCEWAKNYYPANSSQHLQTILPSFLAGFTDKDNDNYKPGSNAATLIKKTSAISVVNLTSEQRFAIEKICGYGKSFILHGVTGSGKTQVYIKLARELITQGKSVVILTPEIGLTSQLASQLGQNFENIVVFHSNLTDKARRKIWKSIIETPGPYIIIGPRSCLFLPVSNLGMIVMDEAHDSAYKQDQLPKYQISRAAAKLAEIHDAKFIMGTATPLVSDYYIYQKKNLPILEMKNVASSHKSKVTVDMIDLKDRSLFKHSSWLSDSLISKINQALQNRQQAILYLNRRGTARLVVCDNCGWQASCDRCDLGLAYHGDIHKLLCHVCGRRSDIPDVCPKCFKHDIKYRSIGTKSIMQEAQKLFPAAKIARFDTDNIKSEKLETMYSEVESGKIDILVGTKMLSKGLDLANLSVVGVIVAESSLLLPDFSAEETEFQQLSQIKGRLGRSKLPGYMAVQSYNPKNQLILDATNQDYQSFYKRELKNRQAYLYPPFTFLLVVTASRSSSKSAQTVISKILESIKTSGFKVQGVGPAPAFHSKLRGQYRWQCVIKSKNRQNLTDIIKILPANVNYDLDPVNLL